MGTSLLTQTLFGPKAPFFAALALLSFGVLVWRRFFRRPKADEEVSVASRWGGLAATVAFPLMLAFAAYRLWYGRPFSAGLSLAVPVVMAGLAAWLAYLAGWAAGTISLMLKDRLEFRREPSITKLELRSALVLLVLVLYGGFRLWQQEALLRQARELDAPPNVMLAFWARDMVQKDLALLRTLAGNPHQPPGLLLEIALSEDQRWTRPVPDGPWDLLFGRLTTPRSIFGAVARNPTSPKAALTLLAGNPAPEVALGVLENSAADGETRALLAEHPDLAVQRAVAASPLAPPAALARLLASPDAAVRAAALANPLAVGLEPAPAATAEAAEASGSEPEAPGGEPQPGASPLLVLPSEIPPPG